MIVLRSVLCGSALVLFGGCGSDGKTAPVSGIVTLNGKPVADVAVTFQPIVTDGKAIAGPSAFGVTGSDGRYTVKLYGTDKTGAAVGKNQVRICGYTEITDTSEEALKKANPKINIPTRYWNEPKFEFEVPSQGTNSADFQLTSP